MSDVTLSAAVRQSLLSLQNTTDLVERTQGRLSTGLRVASAVDDPVAFFQAKSLSDRASDFLEKKDAIDQGISTVTAALDGVEGIESIVTQMKGIANSMKSGTDAQISDLVTQYNDLRTQLNNLATDSSYQGTNLINGTGQTLSVEFSEQSASLLTIDSVDLTVGTNGLTLNEAAYYTADNSVNLSLAAGPDSQTFNGYLGTDDTLALTYNGSNATFSVGETISFTYGTGSSFDFVVASNAAVTLTNGGTIDVDLVSAATSVASTASFYLLATQTRNLYVSYTAQAICAADGTAVTAGTAVHDTITITYLGDNSVTLTTADSTLDFSDAANTFTLQLASGTTYTITGASDTLTVTVYSAATVAAELATGLYVISTGGISANTAGTTAFTQQFGLEAGFTALTAGEIVFTGLVKAGDTTRINSVIDQLDTALTTLRTQSQTLGSNVALLNTRLDFTAQYVNTLQAGSDKLTLADINEEGANLLALQTRQQLGIQSLSLAAQAEASILQLFG